MPELSRPRWVLRAAVVVAAMAAMAIASSAAYAQGSTVFQNGTVVPNHLAKWFTTGRIGDVGGILGDSNGIGVSPFAITDNGDKGLCTYDSPTLPGPTHALCFGHDKQGNAVITSDGGGSLSIVINGVRLQAPGAIAGMAVVMTNADLLLTATTIGGAIVRLDYYSGGGAPAMFYSASNAACTLNSGAGDNGSQVKSADNKCWIAQPPASGIDVREFGAKCDGTTDDSGAFIKALASVHSTIVGPDDKVCRSSAMISIPQNKTLRGANAANISHGNALEGFIIKCDLNVTPCVRVLGALVNVAVDRVAGTPTAGATGIAMNGQMVVLDNVASMRSPVGISIGNPSAGVTNGGLGAFLNRVVVCGSSDTFLLINSWAETRVNQSRFGCNGETDVPSNSYVKVVGAGWPNGFNFVNTQFNTGISTAVAQCFISFVGPFSQAPEGLTLTSVHVEVHNHGICSDTNTPLIQQIQISNSDFWGGFGASDSEFFWQNAATSYDRVNISNSEFKKHGSYVLKSAQPFNDIRISNSLFRTNIGQDTGVDSNGPGLSIQAPTVTPPAGSKLSITGINTEKFEIEGTYKQAVITGTMTGGVYNRATGPVSINVPGFSLTDCPVSPGLNLSFGGGTTGITYAGRGCYYQRVGNQVTWGFFMQLSNKGSSTGSAVISGMPYTSSGQNGVGTNVLAAVNMTGLAGSPVGSTAAGQKSMNLYQYIPTGLQALTEAQFTNSSIIQGLITYTVDPGG